MKGSAKLWADMSHYLEVVFPAAHKEMINHELPNGLARALANVNIIQLDEAAFLVDREAAMESERLLQIWTKHLTAVNIRRQESRT
jgi:hypothetical protein